MVHTKQNETPRVIAERLLDHLDALPDIRSVKLAAIEAALNAERGRIIEVINRFSICRDHDQPTHCVHCDLRHKAIAEIRVKTNGD